MCSETALAPIGVTARLLMDGVGRWSVTIQRSHTPRRATEASDRPIMAPADANAVPPPIPPALVRVSAAIGLRSSVPMPTLPTRCGRGAGAHRRQSDHRRRRPAHPLCGDDEQRPAQPERRHLCHRHPLGAVRSRARHGGGRSLRTIGNSGMWFDANAYPPEAIRAGEQGRASVWLMVDAGKPASCVVVTSSGSPMLDTETATSRWRTSCPHRRRMRMAVRSPTGVRSPYGGCCRARSTACRSLANAIVAGGGRLDQGQSVPVPPDLLQDAPR